MAINRSVRVLKVFAILLFPALALSASDDAHLLFFARDTDMLSPVPSSPSLHTFPSVPVSSFPDDLNDSVHGWIRYYTREDNFLWVQRLILSSYKYTGYIRKEVMARGLPPELIFLPSVESGFNPHAVSKSGAMGLWQFMTNSISPFNIRINSYVDERRDLVKSTRGALSKLEYNYSRLGDWLLAIAAYNCGLGAMERALASSGKNNFWDVRSFLPQETRSYIPKFLALSSIFMHPERYGFIPGREPLYEWVFHELHNSVDLKHLAITAGIDPSVMKSWHPELTGWISPPDSAPFLLKVPLVYADTVKRVISSSGFKGMEYHYKTVKRGETFYGIALSAGISVDFLKKHNPGINPDLLKAGQVLCIPGIDDRILPEEDTTFSELAEYRVYTVHPGDTLWSISRMHGTYPENLAYWNGIDLHVPIRPGQELKVPLVTEGQ